MSHPLAGDFPLDAAPAGLSAEIDELLRGAREYQLAALAPNTLRAYRNGWREFLGFCERHGFTALPASARTVEMYLKWCADERHHELRMQMEREPERLTKRGAIRHVQPMTPLKLSAIEQRLAAIATVHRLNNLASPTRVKTVELTMEGILAAHGQARGREPKRSITPDELRLLVGRLDDSLAALRDRALLLLGYLGGMRRSELATMNLANVGFENAGLVYTLWRSKTNRLGRKGPQRKAIRRNPDPALCPVRALERWLVAAPAEMRQGVVFCNLVHGRLGPRLSARSVHGILYQRTLEALWEWLEINAKTDALVVPFRRKNGRWIRSCFTPETIGALVMHYSLPVTLDPRTLGAHSLRSGFVTRCRELGVADFAIREVTGHESDRMLNQYTHSRSLWKNNPTGELF